MADPKRTVWRERYAEAAQRLGSKLEARRLVEEAASSDWPACLDEPVSKRADPYFAQMLDRRARGEPLQYVLGRWGFRTLDLLVDRRVLIPRPETELVVEVALDEARRLATKVAADLGTGSGAIALSLASELPGVEVWATDASDDALRVARANLTGIGTFAAARVRIVRGDWFAALPADLRGRLQLVVSNPPYIADDEILPAEVAEWEPAAALRSGPTGLEAVAALITEAPDWLDRPGALVLEIAPHQADSASGLAAQAGFGDVRVEPDLTGRARALVARIDG